MKKQTLLLIAFILFLGITVASAESNKSLAGQKIEPVSAEIITQFYEMSLGKTDNKKCFRDYSFSNGDAYYCLTYDKKDRNKLKGYVNCIKNGECKSQVEDVYTFNRNGQLSSYLYWYKDGKLKSVKVTYKYDRNGRIKSEKEKDKSTSKILGETVITYAYEGDTQTQTLVERRLDFPPIFKREKVLETKTNDCKKINCYYAKSFLPQLVLKKR